MLAELHSTYILLSWQEGWESWEPDPVDADPAKVSRGRRSADIISMLVNIYGSKKIFVNEYRDQ